MTSWTALTQELDAWAALGRTAEFWWRDDDATQVTPALEQLIAAQHQHSTPVMLAVIPARAEEALAHRLAGENGVVVVQHGWAHANHAQPGRAKAELGLDRAPAFVLGELTRGALALDRLFAAAWLRVLVPPHNRIAPEIAAGVADAGYIGLSRYNARRAVPHGVVEINAHVDIMNWTTRRFLGEGACLALACAHLAARRDGRADPGEPTGLLTHHLAHDPEAWHFVDQFVGTTSAHRATRWCDPRALFSR